MTTIVLIINRQPVTKNAVNKEKAARMDNLKYLLALYLNKISHNFFQATRNIKTSFVVTFRVVNDRNEQSFGLHNEGKGEDHIELHSCNYCAILFP